MTAIIQGYQLRTALFGVQTIKAAQALPQNTTSTLATVSGGAVMVSLMLGLVTTSCSATATNLSLGTVPTLGTSSATGIASATAITSKENGTMMIPLVSAGVGGALVVCTNAGYVPFMPTPLIVSAGTITWTTSANNSGQMKWYFLWTALDNGAALS